MRVRYGVRDWNSLVFIMLDTKVGTHNTITIPQFFFAAQSNFASNCTFMFHCLPPDIGILRFLIE